MAGLLEAVGLSPDAARKFPCNLSGGQQQRAMTAMALAAEPDLLVADEPTTALDATTQKEILAFLGVLAADIDIDDLMDDGEEALGNGEE